MPQSPNGAMELSPIRMVDILLSAVVATPASPPMALASSLVSKLTSLFVAGAISFNTGAANLSQYTALDKGFNARFKTVLLAVRTPCSTASPAMPPRINPLAIPTPSSIRASAVLMPVLDFGISGLPAPCLDKSVSYKPVFSPTTSTTAPPN